MAREITAPTPSVLTAKSFDGKHTIQFSESSHRYKLDGKPCVGTTTFEKAGYPTSMGLIQWMKGESINFTFDWFIKRGSVTGITEEERKELFKAAKAADQKSSQAAADIGTLVHDFAYLTELGKTRETEALYNQIIQLPEESKTKILNGMNRFKDWKGKNSDELVASETLIASPTHMFCGKFDRLARRNGKLILDDFKTSNSIYPDHFIQLGAYAIAIKEWLGLDVEALEILRFGKEDGEFQTMMIDKKDEIEMFKAQAIRCRETYEFRKIEQDERFKWKPKNDK